MALDQSQEHSVKYLKDGGGIKGLYGRPEEKFVVELSKPEVLRAIDEFEEVSLQNSTNESSAHSDSAASDRQKFIKDLSALLNVVKDGRIANPFEKFIHI